MTTFSISVPVGAWHSLLPTCLASLAAQREAVQVSLLDASGDCRVRELADRYDRVFAYRRHGPDKGQSDAIDEGWRNADGDVLGWLNADDWLFPDAITKVRRLFEADASIDVVAGHSAVSDLDGRMIGYHWAVEAPGEVLRRGCVISQPSCFFRRAASEVAGGLDPALNYTMDWDLWLRMFEGGARFSFLPEPLSVVYWGAGTKTIGFGRRRRGELERIIAKYTPYTERFRARRGFALRAMLDAIRPPALKALVEPALRRRSPSVFGVGPNGRLGEESTIFWAHYDPGAKRALTVSLLGAAEMQVRASRPVDAVVRRKGEIVVEFAEPVAAGERVAVELRKSPLKQARLLHCAWTS